MNSFSSKKQLQRYIKNNRDKIESSMNHYLLDIEQKKKEMNFESMSIDEKATFLKQVEEYNKIVKQLFNGCL